MIFLNVAQTGADSGIRNRLFTTWLPPGQAFAGLSGHIALSGNAPGFSEALVLIGTSADSRQACAARNNTIIPGMPGTARLWAGILKSNDATPVSLAVAVTLPTPLPPRSPQGTCLVTLISAGYPFLRRDAALYATTQADLSVATAPATGAAVQTFGIGGEFRFSLGAQATANYVGIQANRTLTVDAIAAALSAGPVTGAPAGAHWGQAPRGGWQAATDFLLVPAAACRAAHLASHQANADYTVLRLADPEPIAPPAGSITLLHVPLASQGSRAVQVAASPAMRPLRLQTGDCLIAFERALPGEAGGVIDLENQSTLYLR